MTTGSVHHEGAEIVYDRQGDGPLLLMIPGGGGESAQFARIAPILARGRTVVAHDRRGNSRSTGDTTVDLDMAQQARDAAAVIRAVGDGRRAHVFGNSGGATIALQLAADHPELLDGVIAHEAPTITLLPDADEWTDFTDRVHDTFVTAGTAAAFRAFARGLVGFDTSPHQARVGKGEAVSANAEFFMAREYLPIARHRPDLDAVRRNRLPVVTAAGRDSADAYYARTARIQAEILGCPRHLFPGNHLGFFFEPEAFAAAMLKALGDMPSRAAA